MRYLEGMIEGPFEFAKRRSQELADSDAPTVLRWALGEYGREIAFACSFGAEDVVMLDLLATIDTKARVFVLDTGRLHQETYDVMGRCRERYGFDFETYFPKTAEVENLVRLKGPNSFYESIENRRECCEIRKVEPLNRALADKAAWITGLRRDQSITRTSLPKVEADFVHGGIIKINPLAEWSLDQIWAYIRTNDVPYNALHDEGFPSIGCAPCTRAIKLGEDLRAGRWWWENPEQKECGIHIKK